MLFVGMRAAVLVTAASILTACTGMLPRSHSTTHSPWAAYEEAQQAFDEIVPGWTTVAELRALQLDPRENPNIAILNYSDVLRRFIPNASTSLDTVDPAVRHCILAATRCKGYSIALRSIRKTREGNLFADVLGFRRETRTTGWSFNGLVLIEDDAVVYKLMGGQPHIVEQENRNSPLGSVMSLRDSVLGP